MKINENETKIAIKRQEIESENIKATYLKNDLENKNKLILDTQNLIEQKQSQLQVRILYAN